MLLFSRYFSACLDIFKLEAWVLKIFQRALYRGGISKWQE